MEFSRVDMKNSIFESKIYLSGLIQKQKARERSDMVRNWIELNRIATLDQEYNNLNLLEAAEVESILISQEARRENIKKWKESNW